MSEAIRSLSTLALIVVVLVAGGTRRAGRRQRGEGGGWSGTIRETRVHPAQGCTYRGLEGASLKSIPSSDQDPLQFIGLSISTVTRCTSTYQYQYSDDSSVFSLAGGSLLGSSSKASYFLDGTPVYLDT